MSDETNQTEDREAVAAQAVPIVARILATLATAPKAASLFRIAVYWICGANATVDDPASLQNVALLLVTVAMWMWSRWEKRQKANAVAKALAAAQAEAAKARMPPVQEIKLP